MSIEYDTWGRTLAMTYPDKERVSYAYGLGGELRSVASFKNGISKSLIDSIHYDKFGDRTAVFYGNGAVQTYAYDPLSRRLNGLRGRTSGNALMQDISYTYDGVGNVTTIENTASPVGSLGGPYTCSYTYDHLNRLTATNCQQGNNGYTEQRTYLDDGRIATYDLNGTRKGYAYNTAHTHTLSNIHTLPNRISEVLLSFGWDAKGNMTAQNDRNGNRRNLLWDERNRLLAVLDNATIGTAAHYVYDAQGERTFKLTGYTNSTGSVETTETYVSLDEPTLYASPYLTATAEGYTKHYFAGTERLASAIGNGGIASIGTHIVDNVALSRKRAERNSLLNRVMGSYPLRVNSNRLDTLYGMTQPGTTAELTFFFHPDHLGSASWITDMSGQPVQHLQYKPFGGEHVDQQAPGTDYSERFRFTGKERDAETGYDYFGARYYSSSLGIWLSVDPLSDKYPSLSPYVYCADNPMKLVDPTGMIIDPSRLSESEKKAYYDKIKKLNSNRLFQVFYNRLSNSEICYFIMSGSGEGGSGAFNPNNNEIYAIDNLEVLSQEMFHAYQTDLGVYSDKDLSVRETEGDLVSSSIALSLGELTISNPWDQGIGLNYTDENLVFDEKVLSASFDKDFNKAVDARIEFYMNRQRLEGAEAPKTYIQKNSGTGALALKKLIREANANMSLTGPRLQNGDFFSK